MDVKNTDATEKKSKLERIEQRISRLEKQKKAIQAKENEKKRKERTRKLIQIGAIAIKYLDCPGDIEPEDFEKRIKVLIDGIPKGMGHDGCRPRPPGWGVAQVGPKPSSLPNTRETMPTSGITFFLSHIKQLPKNP